MSVFMALLGIVTQDATFHKIAQENILKCHPFRHYLAQRPEMSTFMELLGIETQDAILHDIA